MKFLRYRLLTVMLIGVVTSALSLLALVRLMASTAAQRRERGLDAITQQVERLVAAGPARAAQILREPASGSLIGMRGGFFAPSEQGDRLERVLAQSELPPAWRAPLVRAMEQVTSQAAGQVAGHAIGRAPRAVYEEPLGASLLQLSVERLGDGSVAWAGLLLPPSRLLRTWSVIVVLLAVATALLTTTSISAVVSFRRSAAALNRCLRALAQDLSTPVPRPRVRELSEVADGILSLAQSLAQAREAEARLGRELAQKERLAALGRVVAGVAHEVRNPLASIKLRLDLAKLGGDLPAEAELAVSHATSEIERLDRLVADLLVVAGRQLGPRRQSEIGALVRARVEVLRPWAAAQGIVLTAQGEGRARVDSESVARAIDNLLRNAIEASPRGATVTAHVLTTASSCLVRVEDSGPGIRSGAELFEPFYTTKADGTGLGLALSRAIARAHGGDVTYCRVPAADGASDRAADRAAEPAEGRERTRFELSLAAGPDPAGAAAPAGALGAAA
ncbi:MAG: ATP-binding protein [Polyangia bacterium]